MNARQATYSIGDPPLIRGEYIGNEPSSEILLKQKSLKRGICRPPPSHDRSSFSHIAQGTHNMGETWFLNIRKGDTPENNQFAAHVLKLIEMIENEQV